MFYVKAIYKIPNIKTVIFVVTFLTKIKPRMNNLKIQKAKILTILNIFEYKHYIKQSKKGLWTLEILGENDFLTAIYTHKKKHERNIDIEVLAFDEPLKLNLLTLNCCQKQPASYKFSDKYLGMPSKSDIIQIYI